MAKYKQPMVLRADRQRKPRHAAVWPAVPHSPPYARANSPLAALQHQVGNRAVQRMLAQRQTPEETLTQDGTPGVKGSYAAALVADILTVLDTGITVAELGIPLVEAIGSTAAGAAAFAGVSGLAAIGFIVASLYGLAEAYKTGEKWAAVMGESYAILYCAHGRRPPGAPGWMKAGAAFNDAAEKARQRISRAVQVKGKGATQMLSVLIAMRRQPETALNQVYQRLVSQHLQATFLGMKLGGRLYHVAKSYRLTWPDVKAVAT